MQIKNSKTGTFLYRDGDNYKFTFSRPIPKGVKLNDEITYDQLGITRKEFHDDIIGYKYDKTSDHNFVTLIAIEK